MPPKKPAADAAAAPPQSSSDAPAKEKKKSGALTVRKSAAHPSTAIMVKEALKALDSRKGVSSQAMQNYIKQKYPSVDVVRLKHLVRRALKKGIESGALVRPANSNVSTGATGKFRENAMECGSATRLSTALTTALLPLIAAAISR